jgi:hypothetical protein
LVKPNFFNCSWAIFDVSGQPSIVIFFVFENNFCDPTAREKVAILTMFQFLKWYQAGNSL